MTTFDGRSYEGLDFARHEKVAAVQTELLRQHVAYAATHSPFYRRLFASAGVDAAAIRNMSDLALLPFTRKRDLELHHEEFLAVPPAEIADLCLTSGTTGKAVTMLQSRNDLDRLGYNEETSFRATGITSADRVLIAAAIDRCFMAGLAYFLGLTRIGATVIRGGSSTVPMLVETIRTCRPSAVVGVPSLLLAVGERLQSEGVDPVSCGIVRMICIGEPVRREDLTLSPLGERLAACWGSRIFGTYASTEMATAFTDCDHGLGGHFRPELMLIEVVDQDGNAIPPGETGEVVATPLGVTGMPLLRFRTGDIAALQTAPCPCGRTSHRLGPIVGRKAQMLKVRGTTVYPPAIFTVLQGLPEVRGYYVEAYSDFDLSDRLKVVIASSDPSLSGANVAERIAAAIRVKPEVVIVSPEEVARKTLPADKRKPVTFFDYRDVKATGVDRSN